MKSIRFVSWIILPVLIEEYSGTSADIYFRLLSTLLWSVTQYVNTRLYSKTET
jgi:hypothetical protein